MNQSKNIGIIIIEAILIGIFMILLAWLSQTELIFALLLFFVPIIIAAYVYRRDEMISIGVTISIVALTYLFNFSTYTYYGLLAVPLGVTLGVLFRKKSGMPYLLGISSAVSLLGVIAWFSFENLVLGFPSIVDILTENFKTIEIPQDVLDLMVESMGISSLNAKTIFIESTLLLLPAIIIIMIVSYGLINYWMTHGLLMRMGTDVERRILFRNISLPQNFVSGMTGILLLSLLSAWLIPSLETQLFATIVVLIATAFSIQGVALLSYVLNKNGIKGIFQVPIVIFVLVFVQLAGLAIIGSIDAIFDFRKLRPKKG